MDSANEFALKAYRTSDRHTLPSSAYNLLVEDFLIKGGTTLLSGDPKAGKSTVVKNLAHGVATGEPFMGREVVQGLVSYILLDDSPGWTLETLVRMNQGKDVENVLVTERVGFRPNHYMNHLRHVADAHPEVKLIVIDTLSKSLPLENINDYKPVEQGLNDIANFAHETSPSSVTAETLKESKRKLGKQSGTPLGIRRCSPTSMPHRTCSHLCRTDLSALTSLLMSYT